MNVKSGPEAQIQIGTVLGNTFGITFRNVVPFVVISTLMYVPFLAWTAYYASLFGEMSATGSVDRMPGMGQIQAYQYFTQWGGAVMQALVAASLIWAVFQDQQGRRPGLGATLSNGMKHAPRALGVALVVAVLTQGPNLLASLLASASVSLAMFIGIAGSLVSLVLSIILFVSIPACVAEGTSVAESLKRSVFLTYGARVSIFVVMLVIGVLYVAVLMPIQFLESPRLTVWLTAAVIIGISMVNSVLSAVVYRDVRRTREGADEEHLASVFE